MDKSLELEVEKLSVDADLEKKKKEVSMGISTPLLPPLCSRGSMKHALSNLYREVFSEFRSIIMLLRSLHGGLCGDIRWTPVWDP